MGLTEPGTYKVTRSAYRLLELITYFTAGEKEVRAWTIRKGWKAPKLQVLFTQILKKASLEQK